FQPNMENQNANFRIGQHMEQIRIQAQTEQDNAEIEVLSLIDRDSGRFYFENEPVAEEFNVQNLQTLESIGRGSFTESVKRSIYTPRKLTIAVKIIHMIDRRSGQNDGKGEAEIVREAENARRSAHDNVVWLHGFVVEQMTCYMCMELMQANVDEVKKVAHDQAGLNIGNRFTNEEIEKFLGCVTVAVVDGLSHLRERARVMHRDIKPNNIMINDRGQVKICDFGVSKRLVTGITSTRARTTGAGCITYMAPEQFSDDVHTVGYGSKAGVWSLGISLHELATGHNAFLGLNDLVIATQIATGDPPRIPRSDHDGFSSHLRNFVDACLFKDELHRASLVATEPNCLQKRQFYKRNVERDDRKSTVMAVLDLVTPHLPHLRHNLGG
ncbi:hypothetical protein PMAYCL1PPCAC_19782, partial [Pristionchus mayeri]